jgi:hypothetical protein
MNETKRVRLKWPNNLWPLISNPRAPVVFPQYKMGSNPSSCCTLPLPVACRPLPISRRPHPKIHAMNSRSHSPPPPCLLPTTIRSPPPPSPSTCLPGADLQRKRLLPTATGSPGADTSRRRCSLSARIPHRGGEEPSRCGSLVAAAAPRCGATAARAVRYQHSRLLLLRLLHLPRSPTES